MYDYNNELYHYGVKGMKWGHRKKYYNDDGSLNKLGQARQNYKTAKKEYNKSFDKAYNKAIAAYSPVKKHRQANDARWEDTANKAEASRNAKAEYKQAKKEYKESHPMSDKQKTALKVGAAAVGTALAVYGAYKVNKFVREKHEMLAIGRKSLELDSIRPFMESRAKFHQLDPNSSSVQNEINAIYRGTVNQIKNDARKDSFRTAAKDVYDNRKYLIDKARKEKWLKQF